MNMLIEKKIDFWIIDWLFRKVQMQLMFDFFLKMFKATPI